MLRFFIISLCGLALFLSSSADAQAVPRIVALISQDSAAATHLLAGFRADLETHGVQVEFKHYSLNNARDEAQKIVAELKSSKVDLVLALGSLALQTAGEQLSDIPVIASLVLKGDAIKQYPNVTGISIEVSLDEQIAWLQKILPKSKNIGVIYSSDENRQLLQRAEKMTKKRGLTLFEVQISDPSQLTPALKQLENKADVFLGVPDAMVLNAATAKNILLFSLRNKIPFVGLSDAWVKAGALYALQGDYNDIGQQCAGLARELLAGKKLADLNVMGPRSTHYSLNLKVAERIKIDFPRELIKNAETVF